MNPLKRTTSNLLPAAAELTMRLLYVRESDHEDDWHSIMHDHLFAEIFYVTRGQGRMRLSHGHLDLEAGDLLFVNANIMHTEQRIGDEPFAYIVVGVEGISMTMDTDDEDIVPKNLYEDWAERGIIQHRSIWQQSRIGNLLDTLRREMEEKPPYYEEYCHKLLELLLISLSRQSDQKVTLKSGTTQVSQVEFVRKFIDHHFSRQISLNDLAANSYMDKFHLVRKFKESYGSTPIDYLLERRISAAETLIKMTSHTLEEIAKIVGFNSQAYFCKVFKERRGLSPSVYRRSAHREKMTAD